MARRLQPTDIVGQTFTYLTVVSYVGYDGQYHRYECVCVCGKQRTLLRSNLVTGNTKSCGCKTEELLVAARTKHGMRDSHVYRVWAAMVARCTNPHHTAYARYGGRGITVCPQWIASFATFLRDMKEPPTPQHQIDRRKNAGNYEPGNCRWVTRTINGRNTRRNVEITINGQTKCIAEWAEITGLCDETIRYRYRTGWPTERILEKPGRRGRPKAPRGAGHEPA